MHHCCAQERRGSGDLGGSALAARPKASAELGYLNELYRSRAEKAGIVYVDVWEGFVDEAGKYSPQGPDYKGRSPIAHWRRHSFHQVRRSQACALRRARNRAQPASRGMPVALPVPAAGAAPQAPNAKPGGPAQRPAAGPVVPLTAMQGRRRRSLIGGGRAGGRVRRATQPPRAWWAKARPPPRRADGPTISVGRAARARLRRLIPTRRPWLRRNRHQIIHGETGPAALRTAHLDR